VDPSHTTDTIMTLENLHSLMRYNGLIRTSY